MDEIGMELLERYLAGRVSTDEARRVETWLAEDLRRWQALRALGDRLKERDLSDQAVKAALSDVWARLASDIGAENLPPPDLEPKARPSHRFFPPRSRRGRLIAQAAAVVLLMLGGWLAVRLVPGGPLGSDSGMVLAATAPAQTAMLRLPDGTQVMLGVASNLRYPKAFSSGTREVSLEGEAYFDVRHAPGGAFVVRAGDMVATDLGTKFTARAYAEDGEARVVVREGRVAVGAAGTPSSALVVSPGQVGRVAAGMVLGVERADTAAYFAWMEGRLVLDSTSLGAALPELGRWFDLDFRLASGGLRNIPLTATLKAPATMEALRNLCAALGLRYEKRGRMVTLYPADQAR